MSMPVSRPRGGDDAADIAIGDQHDARAGLAHLGDQLGMARPVEDADDEIRGLGLLGLGECLQVGGGRLVEIDDFAEAAADRDLVHIDVGRVQEAALDSAIANTASALAPPFAVRVVPSSGSSAMSILGPCPVPTFSPI